MKILLIIIDNTTGYQTLTKKIAETVQLQDIHGRSRFTRFRVKIYITFRIYAIIFGLRRFENLHDNFRFNAIWHRRSVASLIFREAAESDVTVTPLVTCTDYVCDINTRSYSCFFTGVGFCQQHEWET